MWESRHRRHRRQRGNLLYHHKDGSGVHLGDDRYLAAIYGKQALFVNSIQDYRRRRPPNGVGDSSRQAIRVFIESTRTIASRGTTDYYEGGFVWNSAEDHCC